MSDRSLVRRSGAVLGSSETSGSPCGPGSAYRSPPRTYHVGTDQHVPPHGGLDAGIEPIGRPHAVAAIALVVLGTAAFAAQDTQCRIEDWKWKYNGTHRGQSIIRIEGTTTCKDGVARLRVYDGNGKLLGVGGTFIGGHIFHKDIFDVAPNIKAIKIRAEISGK